MDRPSGGTHLVPRLRGGRIKGTSVEKSPERPVLTIGQVYSLPDAIGPRYRALVLLACFCGLGWGELAGLQRADIDCDGRTVRIACQLCEVAGRQPFSAAPKSDAGKRTVSIPPLIVADVSSHLDTFTQPEADALVSTSPHGMPLRHASFCRRAWHRALAATGLSIHLHNYADACLMPTSPCRMQKGLICALPLPVICWPSACPAIGISGVGGGE